jgi:hypothetical protein
MLNRQAGIIGFITLQQSALWPSQMTLQDSNASRKHWWPRLSTNALRQDKHKRDFTRHTSNAAPTYGNKSRGARSTPVLNVYCHPDWQCSAPNMLRKTPTHRTYRTYRTLQVKTTSENGDEALAAQSCVVTLVRHWPWCTFSEGENETTTHRTHRTHQRLQHCPDYLETYGSLGRKHCDRQRMNNTHMRWDAGWKNGLGLIVHIPFRMRC